MRRNLLEGTRELKMRAKNILGNTIWIRNLDWISNRKKPLLCHLFLKKVVIHIVINLSDETD